MNESRLKLKEDYTIIQSNGFVVDLVIHQDDNNNLNGSASIRNTTTTGTLKGYVDGKQVVFQITWSGGLIGEYDGMINRELRIYGIGIDIKNNVLAMWSSI